MSRSDESTVKHLFYPVCSLGVSVLYTICKVATRSVRKCKEHNGIVKKLSSHHGPFSTAPGLCLHRCCMPNLACLSSGVLTPMWGHCLIWLDVPCNAQALLGSTCAATSLPAHTRIAPPFPFLPPQPSSWNLI
jgi:hypothetical protein